MLRVENLTKRYKGSVVLDRIDLAIERGKFIIITGRSGGGKTTLLSIMGGLTSPDEGTVFLEGKDIWALSEPELATLRNQQMGFVFQFPSLVATLTVLDNVLLPIAFSGRNPTRADMQLAESLLEKVSLSDWGKHFPSQLSGGQQRRVALARAMINRPSLILTDEPTGDLDERSEEEIMQLFREANREGTTIVMVTHALSYVQFGETYTLKQGRLVPYEKAEVAPAPRNEGI